MDGVRDISIYLSLDIYIYHSGSLKYAKLKTITNTVILKEIARLIELMDYHIIRNFKKVL